MINKQVLKTKKRKGLIVSAIRQIATLALLLPFLLANVSAQKKAVYANPVLAGDYPDPSVIRVGADFYATATSSEWSPEFQILHSRDLVNWQIVGDVFPQRPAWSVGNYWAPEIWQDKGRFYVFYVARKEGGSLCVAAATAAKPVGPYTDRGPLVCQDAGSIDPFPVRDERGKLFLVWKEDGNSVGKPTPLWAQELDEKTFKLVGDKHEILRNDAASWEANLVEAPYILRRGAWFYLFYSGNACCGLTCNYALGVARSKTLLGPWEKNPANPILKGNEDWRCPGHGSIVTNENGRTFLLYHAYDSRETVYVGRQGVLDEVKWTQDNWAEINAGRGPSKTASAPLPVGQRAVSGSFLDDFTAPKLQLGWQWQQNNVPVYRTESGFLVLAPNAANTPNEIGGVMARSTTLGDYAAAAELARASLTKNQIAGISAYGDNENAVGIGVKDGQLVVWKREKNNQQVITDTQAPKSAQVFLKMTARDGHFFQFAVSGDNKVWQNVGAEVDGAFLPPWDRGVRIALYTGGSASAAKFGFLRIEPAK